MTEIDIRLAAALREAGLSRHAEYAERGYFSRIERPLETLVHDLVLAGTKEALALRDRVVSGEFGGWPDEGSIRQ